MKSNLLVGFTLVLAAPLFAQAQSPAGKVGVINIQGAIVNTKDGQKAAAELETKSAPKRKDLEQKQNQINGLKDQLSKGQQTLSDATKAELYKNIEQKTKSLQRDVEDAQAEFDQEQQKILQQLGQKMMAVIDKYARDRGYTTILDVSSPQTPVLYASPTVDITNDIIALYDKAAAPASAPAPAPKTPPGTSAAPGAAKPGTPAKPPAGKPPDTQK